MPSDPIETARRFVSERFPEARAAMVGGSVFRGQATPTSDLDIAILTDRDEAPFRASYRYQDWPVEAFVHTEESLTQFLKRDVDRLRPSLCRMCVEGAILRDVDGAATRIRAQAQRLLDAGPNPLTPEQIEDWRYSLTDLLDDFVGCESVEEGIFIANDLAVEVANLILLRHGRWLGSGKWVPRALNLLDSTLSTRLIEALLTYYRTEDKGPLIQVAEAILQEAGGRLFEGYYRQAKK